LRTPGKFDVPKKSLFIFPILSASMRGATTKRLHFCGDKEWMMEWLCRRRQLVSHSKENKAQKGSKISLEAVYVHMLATTYYKRTGEEVAGFLDTGEHVYVLNFRKCTHVGAVFCKNHKFKLFV
jgi:hypothetical protein